MREIFVMQVQQVLGGRMKWLVVVALTLPVLLSLAVVLSGALRELERELGDERADSAYDALLAAGRMPDSARRVEWKGEDLKLLEGFIRLAHDGPELRGRGRLNGPPPDRMIWVVNKGRFILRGDELWIDEDRGYAHGRPRVHWVTIGDRRDEINPVDFVTVEGLCTAYLFLVYPQVLCLLMALFFGTSALGSELDGKTLTYLFTRPLPRWRIVTGKYLGIVFALIPGAVLSVVASARILDVSSDHLVAILASTVGALVAYSAIFILIGFIVPRRAMIVGLLYGIIFEFVLSFAPALINEITVTYYLRSLVARLLDVWIPPEIARIVGDVSALGAVTGLAAITATALAVASLLAATREYVIKDDA